MSGPHIDILGDISKVAAPLLGLNLDHVMAEVGLLYCVQLMMILDDT